ncbi:NADH:ubiquinone reductase (Na(+)-transporting) subunit A [Falsihalocynthiibacter sp. BN13B15]|uniref:NADH:ubiquinone reductase (Na(+)-transporting) subunit A n=1 Tax=Falsihalocynthiibacter sp. BN13B15 TaxID=3240871 RepID=UPI00350F69A7
MFNLQKGLEGNMGLGPDSPLPETRSVRTVALMGRDYPGVSFDLCVAENDQVGAGQTLCTDRRHPEICFVATVAGRVSQIKRGRRRSLDTLEITAQGDAEHVFDIAQAQNDDAALRQLLLKSGAWTSFQTRPFGFLPDPKTKPSAIFVTAIDTHPLSADPAKVLASQPQNFLRGIEALLRLTDGPVYLCQKPGSPLAPERARLKVAPFSGPHPAGLAGTHIHALSPVSRQRTVWQIGYQDVLAIGHLLETGRIMSSRTVSVAGSGLSKPVLVTAPLGAKLTDLVADPTQTLQSGAIFSGREAAFLGRFDLQVTCNDSDAHVLPSRPFWHKLMDRLPIPQNGATLPLEAFERAFPFDILPIPLMRALAVGDVETAERLGCLELLEEDLALLTWLCPSGNDYGTLLRHALNTLAKEHVE